jgi:LuxR family maltose regulon positive regulatory protein
LARRIGRPFLEISGLAPGSHQVWLIAAFLLEASARDALGEREAAGRALERGLDLTEPDGLLFPFLLHPVPELLERHARQRIAHPALIRKIISVLGGRTPAAPAAGPPEHLPEPISKAEARVLRCTGPNDGGQVTKAHGWWATSAGTPLPPVSPARMSW